jgi:hypothetical protein
LSLRKFEPKLHNLKKEFFLQHPLSEVWYQN